MNETSNNRQEMTIVDALSDESLVIGESTLLLPVEIDSRGVHPGMDRFEIVLSAELHLEVRFEGGNVAGVDGSESRGPEGSRRMGDGAGHRGEVGVGNRKGRSGRIVKRLEDGGAGDDPGRRDDGSAEGEEGVGEGLGRQG